MYIYEMLIGLDSLTRNNDQLKYLYFSHKLKFCERFILHFCKFITPTF